LSDANSNGRLGGVNAVVTGASRGIGEAIARSLAAAGARVALVARDRDALEKLAAAIGGGAFAVSCDVTNGDQVRAAAQAITAAFSGPANILVNNAGLFRVAPAQELAEGDFKSMIEVNLIAPHMFVREFLPAMLGARRGHVVTIGSVADRSAYPGNAGYSATKFGARALHEILRAETKGTGVRATLVSPSATDTPIWDLLPAAKRSSYPKAQDMLRPDDVANAVLYAVTAPATVNVDELRLTRA
jgi:NADP-dependent 3-hydroxy acid dehydrogenase YdfG